tara:strand:+ start:2564 stop:4048 length:1485 start_codon:yes stop_codon:yes gene_type:complete
MILGINNYTQGGRDTAIYQTALWQAGNFYNPIYFMGPGNGDSVFFSLHVMPIGFAYGLLYSIFPSIYTTAIIYIIIYVGTFIFTYLSTKNITNNKIIALGFSIIFLTCYSRPIHDFYPLDDWAILFISGGLYFYTLKSFKITTIFWIIASLHKEYYSLSVAGFGIAILLSALVFKTKILNVGLRKYEIKYALIWIVGGISWFLIAFFGIMAGPDGTWENQALFTTIGGVKGIISEPLYAIKYFNQKLLNPTTQSFLFKLFIPLCFLSIIGFEYTLSIIPIVFILLLADGEHTTVSHGHYTNWFFPFIINGGALGYKRLMGKINHILIRRTVICLVLICTSYNIISGLRLHRYWLKSKINESYAMTYYRDDVKMALDKIPPNAKVATDEYLLPYFANRRFIFHLSKLDRFKPDYIIRDANQNGENRINNSIYSNIYGDSFWNVINKDPKIYYDSYDQKYMNIKNDLYEDYNLIYRFGSIAIYELKMRKNTLFNFF